MDAEQTRALLCAMHAFLGEIRPEIEAITISFSEGFTEIAVFSWVINDDVLNAVSEVETVFLSNYTENFERFAMRLKPLADFKSESGSNRTVLYLKYYPMDEDGMIVRP